jgi:hypothetical protein
MPRQLVFKRDLRQMQVSKDAHEFLTYYKGGRHGEPFYRTLDRFINQYKNSDIQEWIAKCDNQAKVMKSYKDARDELEIEVAELERELQEARQGQMVFQL